MMTRQRRPGFLRRLWMPLLAIGILAYFGYHAFSGSFGIWAMDRLDADAAQLSLQLADLQAEHATLERQVTTVRSSSLDADVIDLEARRQLNLIRPDEIVIESGAPQQSPQ